MRHRAQHRKLGRTSSHRKAMFRNQLTALFTHERIVTTVAKAKELRPVAERMVTMARTGSLPARRKVLTMVPDKDVVRRLFDDIAPRFADRPGGYTRILRLGRRRGDNAEIAIIEFVDYELSAKGETSGEGKASLMDRAKSMLGGGKKSDETAAAPDEAEAAADEAVDEAEAVEAAAEEEKPKKRARKTKKKDEAVEAAAADGEAAEAKPKKKAKKATKKDETSEDAE